MLSRHIEAADGAALIRINNLHMQGDFDPALWNVIGVNVSLPDCYVQEAQTIEEVLSKSDKHGHSVTSPSSACYAMLFCFSSTTSPVPSPVPMTTH